ncbi:hypothetical protein [Limisalsivibrio acetivorans]|uniref:hypothetical protein n=1 Tax=Limisalsivibrio acetivorans TaxID=1304888 RepID=UPI0003B52175|nr:hypothetical protein [Limisalsivibrio acetivorans]
MAVFASDCFAGFSFKNGTKYIMGVRLQNTVRGHDDYILMKPVSSKNYSCDCNYAHISVQLITGSYEIVCCEWVRMNDGKSLQVKMRSNGDRCYCEFE